MHFFVRFEPFPGREAEFRAELQQVVGHSRAEPGCLSIQAFETLHEPSTFAIYSEWVDEAAFELHSGMPYTVRFLEAAGKLLPHPVEGLRTRKIS
jgi:quinol monooxygenase YgiN